MKAYFNDEEIVVLDFEDTEYGPRAKVSYKRDLKRSFWVPTEKIMIQ